jgi:hypothetical protein
MPRPVATAPETPRAGSAAVPPPSRGPERVAYSLIDNRLAAHVWRDGGLFVAAGSAGFAKYVRFGNQLEGANRSWQLQQREGDVAVARMTGKVASVFFPLTKAQAARGSIKARLFALRAGTLTVKLNDDDAQKRNLELSEGWQVVSLDNVGKLVEGENQLQLYASGMPPRQQRTRAASSSFQRRVR